MYASYNYYMPYYENGDHISTHHACTLMEVVGVFHIVEQGLSCIVFMPPAACMGGYPGACYHQHPHCDAYSPIRKEQEYTLTYTLARPYGKQ